MYPARATVRLGYITARDQIMVENGVTKGKKTLPGPVSFLLRK